MLPIDLFRSTAPPWVHLCVLPEGQAPSVGVGSLPGYVIRCIDGRRCTTKVELLSAFARALEFPSYFGRNWDAFEECLTDLSWMPAAGFLIIVTNAERVLAASDADYATFLDSLRTAGREWAVTRETPFQTVLTVSELHEADRADWGLPRVA